MKTRLQTGYASNCYRPQKDGKQFGFLAQQLGAENCVRQIDLDPGACDATKPAAGRELFQASRRRKRSSNDSHRLKQYLGRYGLSFDTL